jgi:anti-sigma regulatory factor (Ser/Thr protein kinase)
MEATRRFLPRPESASLARRFVLSALGGWGQEATDVVALLTSEVVTNVVMHAGPHLPGELLLVGVTRTTVGVRVEVTDGNPGIPVVGHGGADQLSGRGLLFLDALAKAWGVVPNDAGKVVWFEVEA